METIKNLEVTHELCLYIAAWINYELDKKPHGFEVDSYMVKEAIEAFIGGAR